MGSFPCGLARNVWDVDGQCTVEAQRLENRVEGIENVVRHKEPAVAHAVVHLVGVCRRCGVRWAYEALGPIGCHVGGGEGVDRAVGTHGRRGRGE